MQEKKSWAGMMEDIIHGRVNPVDVEDLAMECAEIADRAVLAVKKKKTGSGMDITPLWSDVILDMIRPFLIRRSKPTKQQTAMTPHLIQCGQVADAVEAGEVEGVPV